MTSATLTSSATERDAPVVPDRRAHYAPTAAFTACYTVSATHSFDLDFGRGDGYWTVSDRRTGIFGQGDDFSSAIRDFRRAVVEHLEVLERQPALSDELAAQLEYLRERAL